MNAVISLGVFLLFLHGATEGKSRTNTSCIYV